MISIFYVEWSVWHLLDLQLWIPNAIRVEFVCGKCPFTAKQVAGPSRLKNGKGHNKGRNGAFVTNYEKFNQRIDHPMTQCAL
jgi:hypothetical protein